MKNKAFIAIFALVAGLLSTAIGSAPLTEAYSNCTINSFYASPSTVTTGGSATLMMSTSGCQQLTLSGGSYTNYAIGYGTSMLVGPLYSTTYYTLTGTDSYGNPASASTTVNVGTNQGGCSITSFYASPMQVSSGGSSNISWNTSGCSSVSVTGPNVNSSAFSNNVWTGALYNNATYTITATSLYGYSSTQSLTISANGSQNNGNGAFATTSSALSVTDTSALLNGYINTNNCSSGYQYYCGYNTTYYFLYGTNQYSLYQQTPTQTFSGTAGNVSASVNNLTPNTTYYYKLVATQNGSLSYGSVVSFATTGYNYTNPTYAYVNAITSVATNVTSSSARLNGVVTGNSGTVTAYFEYGTSPSFGSQTSSQAVSAYNTMNYYDTVSVSPNTTYYYRIVGVSNGQKFTGETASFTTPGTYTYVPPVVINNTGTTVTSGFGGNSSYASLSIINQSNSVFAGDAVTYLVSYQNISSVPLSGAIMNIMLPKGVTFRSASQGVLTTNNTVAMSLGTLQPGMAGTVTISTVANAAITSGDNFVATATLAFTLPSTAQDSAIAYSINNIAFQNNQQNNLAGLALFGNGFFPNSFFGWVILLALLLVIIMIARYFYHSANRQYGAGYAAPAAPAPVTHIHYETPVRNTDSVHHI